MTQKERQDRSKEEICRAAMEEFGTLGYDKVTMERICGNHGISKGMMYHYYSNTPTRTNCSCSAWSGPSRI